MNTSNIRPRRAQAGDFDAILALLDHARAAIRTLGIDQWQDGYPEPELIREDIALQRGWVFVDGEAIAGYAVLLSGREPVYDALDGAWLTLGDRYLTIHRMAIDDGYRGTGLSRQMIAFAEEQARSQSLISVRADTHRGNLAMRGLMKNCGYEICGEVRYDVTAGDPIRVAYEKVLEKNVPCGF
ncbi:MAG: GNAT family N-acetyltransferase [Clostridia bacterium]|nr:GNAT family N-acetyltransferase [Clostridia bacterium]